jgi:hypothetical protein
VSFPSPRDAGSNAEWQAVEFGVEIGEYRGVVPVPRRLFPRLACPTCGRVGSSAEAGSSRGVIAQGSPRASAAGSRRAKPCWCFARGRVSLGRRRLLQASGLGVLAVALSAAAEPAALARAPNTLGNVMTSPAVAVDRSERPINDRDARRP